MTASEPVSSRWFFLGVFLTCMCGLMLQIMETRILSVIGYYYLAFFAIGVAMLGMTAGALGVFYRARLSYSPDELHGLLAKIMAGFAWSVLLSLVLLISINLGAQFRPTLTFVIGWIVALCVLLPPYVLLGAAVSLALTRSSQRIHLVYGVDLIGASIGCLATLLLLTITDTYSAILLVGAVGGAAGLAFARARSTRTADAAPAGRPAFRSPAHPLWAVVGLLLLAASNHALGTHGLRPVVIKDAVERTTRLKEERWNSFSRIALDMRPNSEAFMWSPSAIAVRPHLDQGWLNIDGDAGTPIYNYRGDPAQMAFLRDDATAFAYFIRHEGRSAVIGIGGGRDLLTSSVSGFKDITGVEYNPIFVRLFSQDYRDFSGFDHVPGLKLHTDDARSWFARSHDHFDLIQMSLIDTWAATGAGAFTLSENGLYTVNGWKRFLSRLSPTGVFTVSRWFAADRTDETARILSLAMASLIEMGETRPADHIYLIGNGNLSTLIVGRAALTPAELQTLDAEAGRHGYRILAAPNRPTADATFDRVLKARSTDELVRIGGQTELNIAPTWDSNPFFFNQLRLSDPSAMVRAYRASTGTVHGNLAASLTLVTLVAVSGLMVVFVLLGPTRSATIHADRRALVWGSAYFMTIGIAFMFVELSLIQRMSLFLGHPIYGLAIVLFSVILATGLGSLLSDRTMTNSPRSLVAWPLALAAYLAALPFWIGGVLDATETGSLLARAAVCVATIAPAGVLMGFMFPAGMRLCERIDPRLTPWLWAVNGAAGVMASGAAVLVAIQTSLNHDLWIGAAGYAGLSVIALQLARLGDREPADAGLSPAQAAPEPVT
jgi:hypothetical protein